MGYTKYALTRLFENSIRTLLPVSLIKLLYVTILIIESVIINIDSLYFLLTQHVFNEANNTT